MFKDFNEIYPNALKLENGSKNAIIFPESGKTISYDELTERAEKTSAHLKKAGFNRKQRILVNLSKVFLPELVGLLDNCSVTIISNQKQSEIDYLISIGDFSAAIDIETDALPNASWENLEELKSNKVESCLETEGLGMVSSGTSGRGKNLISVPRKRYHYWAFNSMRMFGEETVSLIAVSLAMSAGFSHFLSTLMNKGTAIVPDGSIFGGVSDMTILKIIAQKPNHIHGAPETYKALLRSPIKLQTLRHCRITGSKCPVPLLHEIFEEINPETVNSVYGTNENGPAFVNIMKSALDINESIGVPDEGYDYKITDSNEIWVRGGSGSAEFVNTEDLAEVKDGNIYLLNRSGDVIIKNSYSVVPDEVEKILQECDFVSEVVVFGKQTESTSGKVCCVYTVEDDYNAGDIQEHAKKSLSKYKIPEEWNMVKTIPLTENAKISRKQLSELF